VRKKYDLIFLCDAAIVFPFQRIRSSSALITHRRNLTGSLTMFQITQGDEVWSVEPNFWIAKRARSIKKPAVKGQKTQHPDYPKFSTHPFFTLPIIQHQLLVSSARFYLTPLFP
jgi:hypothetical protein